jgi:hypothetical protein
MMGAANGALRGPKGEENAGKRETWRKPISGDIVGNVCDIDAAAWPAMLEWVPGSPGNVGAIVVVAVDNVVACGTAR